jgi:hypothetical protein
MLERRLIMEESRLYDEFKKDALAAVGYAKHPKADRIFYEAWDRGHSYGYAEILNELKDLASFLDDVLV